MAFFKARILVWPLLLIIALIAGLGVYGAMNAASISSFFSVDSDERDTQVITSISREEEVVLLRLGIEGISEQRQNAKLFGMDLIGSDRAAFIRYSFGAKLGIDGEDVEITKTGENAFLVSIPEFIFIGMDEPNYELAVEQNGLLSWTAPEIDQLEMVSNLVTDETKAKYIEQQRDAMEDQARAFYSGIILSIDPEISLEFEFAG